MNARVLAYKKRISLSFAASALLSSPFAWAGPILAAVEFDQRMLWGGQKNNHQVDLSRFSQGNPVFPGTYSVQFYLNDYFRQESTFTFAAVPDGGDAIPCFTPEQASRMALNLEKLDRTQAQWVAKTADQVGPVCQSIEEIVPFASARYDSSEQRLDVYIPQANLLNQPKDYVDPNLWDSGITAGRLNYSLNMFHSDSTGQQDTQGFLQLDAGFNMAGWRFRQTSSLSKNDYEDTYQVQRTYAQTDVQSLKSTLTVGESYTDGQAFDSFGIRGALMATDDRMLPASQRGYAPVVRGTANTNAKVTITQGGVTLYQRAVAAGPFEITDLDPIGYGSDLMVTVSETDGSSRTFTVPYSASAQLLRPGQIRYTAAIGEASSASMDYYTPKVAQLAGYYGLNNAVTSYAGVMGSEDYRAILVGNALSTPLGGVSADITYAQNTLNNASASNGSSLRLIYSTLIDPTNTNITLSSYRYSTEGYWSFNDVLTMENSRLAGGGFQEDMFGPRFSFENKQKSRFSVNLNQRLYPGWGSVYLSGETRDYWNRNGSDTFYQATYNNTFKKINYSVSLNRSVDQYGMSENQVYLSFNMPLFSSDRGTRNSVSGRTWNSSSGGSQGQLALSGVSGADQQYSYNVSTNQPMASDSGESSYALSGAYQGSIASLTGGMTTSKDSQQANIGITGGVVAHSKGLVFSQSLGETVALIDAENAEGARITNVHGATINPSGYGVVPYLSPYSRNRIELDSLGLSTDVQLDSSTSEVIPAAGSIVKVRFATSKESSGLIVGRFVDGAPLPFGAEVHDAKTAVSVGFVGQGGHIFVRGIQPAGQLTVSLDAAEKCTIDYAFLDTPLAGESIASIASTTGVCTRSL